MLKFRRDFEAGICSAFCRWCFVEVMMLNLGRDFEARFVHYFEFYVYSRCWCLVEILKFMLGRYSEDENRSRFMFVLVMWPKQVTLVSWSQPSGPLCLWQYLIYIMLLSFLNLQSQGVRCALSSYEVFRHSGLNKFLTRCATTFNHQFTESYIHA